MSIQRISPESYFNRADPSMTIPQVAPATTTPSTIQPLIIQQPAAVTATVPDNLILLGIVSIIGIVAIVAVTLLSSRHREG